MSNVNVQPDEVESRRRDALVELGELLGQDVVDVEDQLNARTCRVDGPVRWRVVVRDEDGRTWRLPVWKSAELRDPDRLNRWVAAWSRRATTCRLTGRDGRRVLRLLHEVHEANVALDPARAAPEWMRQTHEMRRAT